MTRQPRAIHIPMMTETHRRLALELRMAVETLIANSSPNTFNQLSKMFAALCSAGMSGPAIEIATNTMGDICDRYERIGKVGVSAGEADALHQAIAGIDEQLPLVPVNKFKQAVAEVEIFCATAGACSAATRSLRKSDIYPNL